MSQPKALFRLQKLDLEIDTRRSRLREIAAELEQDQALRAAQADVAAIEEELRPQQTRITDLNLELQTIDRQTKQLTQRLYGGSVSNPKELEDIQNKIAERKRRHANLENALLETMIMVEDLQAALANAEERLHQAEAERADQTQALTDEQQRLKADLKALKAKREPAQQAVDAANLTLYQDLRAQKQGRPVAVLEGAQCSACGVGQTANIVQKVRQDEEIVRCTSCGRVLVAF